MENRNYYNIFSSVYDNKRDKGYHLYLDEKEVEFALKKLKLNKKNPKVIELGCGTGLIIKHFNLHGFSIFGMDLSEGMLSKAKNITRKLIQADITKLPFKTGTIEGFVCFKVFSHIFSPNAVLQEVHRCLKKDGIFVLDFYNKWSLRFLIKKIIKLKIKDEVKEDNIETKYYSMTDIKKMIGKNFQIVDYSGVRLIIPGYFIFKIKILKSIFIFLEKIALKTIFKKNSGFSLIAIKKE